MTNIKMIFRSKWMLAGVICEFLAFIAAAGNLLAGSWWLGQLLPNVALILATLGAAMVAGRVAWDYHGRGLNARQQEDVHDILASAGLNTTQREEVAQITESSGLNPRQREAVNEILSGSGLNEIQKGAVAQIVTESGLSPRQRHDLFDNLMGMDLWRMVSAQQAAAIALDYLYQGGHGRVAILTEAGGKLVDVQCIDPPNDALICKRQHDSDGGNWVNILQIAKDHLKPSAADTVIWRPSPSSRRIRYVDGNTEPPIDIDGKQWVFSTEDCVPKRLDPRSGDYVLTRDKSGEYTWETWEQKP